MTDEKSTPGASSQKKRGQYSKGSSGNQNGRPKGFRNKATILAEQLLQSAEGRAFGQQLSLATNLVRMKQAISASANGVGAGGAGSPFVPGKRSFAQINNNLNQDQLGRLSILRDMWIDKRPNWSCLIFF